MSETSADPAAFELQRRKQTLDFWKTVIVSGLLATGATVLGSVFTHLQNRQEIDLKREVNAQQYRLKALELEQQHLSALSSQILSNPQPTARDLALFMSHLSGNRELRERWQGYLQQIETKIEELETLRRRQQDAEAEAERLREERQRALNTINKLNTALRDKSDRQDEVKSQLAQAEAELERVTRQSRSKDEELQELRATTRRKSLGTVSGGLPMVQQQSVAVPPPRQHPFVWWLVERVRSERPPTKAEATESFLKSEWPKLRGEASFIRNYGAPQAVSLVGERGRTKVYRVDFAYGSFNWELGFSADDRLNDVDYYEVDKRTGLAR